MAEIGHKKESNFLEKYGNFLEKEAYLIEINVRTQEIVCCKVANKQVGWFTLAENCSKEEYLFFRAYFKARGLPFKKHNLVECINECKDILSFLREHTIELEQKGPLTCFCYLSDGGALMRSDIGPKCEKSLSEHSFNHK